MVALLSYIAVLFSVLSFGFIVALAGGGKPTDKLVNYDLLVLHFTFLLTAILLRIFDRLGGA